MKNRPVTPNSPLGLTLETLENRVLLSAAFDLIQLTAMRADPVFSGIDGTGMAVAIIDTGLDTHHSLISPNYTAGVDFVNGGSTPTVVANHGTHVAGIVGAADPEIGMAPDVDLIALQVFTYVPGQGVLASNQHVEDALQWVEDHYQEYNIVAVNMSLGSGFYESQSEVSSTIFYDEIRRLEASGVTIVSAAGNSYGVSQNQNNQYIDHMSANSASPGILSTLNVGAVWEADEGAYFSSSGAYDQTTSADRITGFSQRPDTQTGNVIFAPGAQINSTIPGNRVTEMSGTSMAAPMVAGSVALMQEASMLFGGRLLSPSEIREILLTTADTIYDGDDEDTRAFIDYDGNFTISSDEWIDFNYTNENYARINIYEAVKEIRGRFDQLAPPPSGGESGSGDPNGVIDGAFLGPRLDGSPVESVRGMIGIDGGTVDVGNTDVDMIRFDVLSPGVVTIGLSSHPTSPDDFDSYLNIFDFDGHVLAFNDDISDSDPFSRVEIVLDIGVYYAAVSGFGNSDYDPLVAGSGSAGEMGNYALNFSLANSDPNGLISGAVHVNLGGGGVPEFFNGNIGTDYGAPVGVSDVDLFEVVIPDDGVLMIDIDTPFDAGYVDSFLQVFDAQGVIMTYLDEQNAEQYVLSDDDWSYDLYGNWTEFSDDLYPGLVFQDETDRQYYDGHTTDSFLYATVERGDVYYIGVSDFDNQIYDPTNLTNRLETGSGGFYNIEITFFNNDLNGSILQAADLVPVALPVVNQEGIIGYDTDPVDSELYYEVGDRDIDFVRIHPDDSGILEIDIDSYTVWDNDYPVDAVLTLFGQDGSYLASNDDSNNSVDSLLRYEVQAGLDYYVAVSGYGNENFDPFQLGSGSPGDTGDYFFNAQILPLSQTALYTDDVIGYAGIQTISHDVTIAGFIGNDDGFVRAGGDVDLYRFIPSVSDTVTIHTDLVASNYNADTYLRVFDALGNELISNDDASATTLTSRLSLAIDQGVTYYIGVNGAGNGSENYDPVTGANIVAASEGDYALTINFDDDSFEPNDTRFDAIDLGDTDQTLTDLSIHASYDEDFFLWTAARDGILDVDIAFNHSQGDLDLFLVQYDTFGEEMVINYSNSKTDDEGFSTEVFSGESFYIVVEGFEGATNPSYTLEVLAPYEDLSVDITDSTGTTPLTGGERFTAQVEVTNYGNTLASGRLDVELWASYDGDVFDGSGDDFLLDTLENRAIKLGWQDTLIVNFSVTLADDFAAGTYSLVAFAYPNDQIADSNPDNDGLILWDGLIVEDPNLTATFGSSTLMATMVPGDRGTVRLNVANDSNVRSSGRADFQLWASLDGDLDNDPGNDFLLGTLSRQSVNLKPQQFRTFTFRVTIPPEAPIGDYYLVSHIDTSNAITESNEADNLTVSGDTRELAWKFGSFDGRKNVKLSLTGQDDKPIQFSLKGDGYGHITNNGLVGIPENPTSMFNDIDFWNTTASTSVSISTAKRQQVAVTGEINVHGSMKSFSAPSFSLYDGTMTIDQTLAKLTWNDLVDSQLTIGPPLSSRDALTMKLGRIEEASITTQTPIKSFILTDWQDSDQTPDALIAPAIKTLATKGYKKDIRGDFEADIILNGDAALTLDQLTVKGSLNNASIRSSGNIGTVTLGAIEDSTIFAGVKDNINGQPSSIGAFDSEAGIAKLNVKGLLDQSYSVVNSNIAAWSLGAITLKDIDTTNDNQVQFGITGVELKSYSHSGINGKFRWTGRSGEQTLPDMDDFLVQLLKI